jgi:hypothetical protein
VKRLALAVPPDDELALGAWLGDFSKKGPSRMAPVREATEELVGQPHQRLWITQGLAVACKRGKSPFGALAKPLRPVSDWAEGHLGYGLLLLRKPKMPKTAKILNVTEDLTKNPCL